MKLGTLAWTDRPRVVVQLSEDLGALLAQDYSDLADVIHASEPVRRTAVDEARRSGERIPLEEASWLPPLRRPGKILCVALNNSANPGRILSGPETPAMFPTPSSALVGSGAPIRLREEYGRVHPEPELAVVIGTGGADIPERLALEHVCGYTIMNDLTSPTMRAEDTFHYRAIHPDPQDPAGVRHVESWVSYPARYKGADTFAPMGPWVTTAEDIPDPHVLRIVCRHAGRTITEDSTANLRFSVAEVIAYASRFMTLDAGDVIAMGTALKASATGGAVQNLDLNGLGGVVEVEIQDIGVLRNPVERRAAP